MVPDHSQTFLDHCLDKYVFKKTQTYVKHIKLLMIKHVKHIKHIKHMKHIKHVKHSEILMQMQQASPPQSSSTSASYKYVSHQSLDIERLRALGVCF